jgi:hypothetical protein
VATLVLATVAGIEPAPAHARDLLILRAGETRRGELASCDTVACRLDGATLQRSDVVFIGLGDPSPPVPAVRNPLQDELHLRDGSVRPGPLVSIDSRQAVTPARAYARRDVRWIYLAPTPARSAGGGGGSSDDGGGRGGDGGGDGACRFWIGSDDLAAGARVIRTVRTVYTVRLREVPRSGNRGLRLDDATVRERLREVVSDRMGGNRTEGSGTSRIDGETSDGLLVLAGPSGPAHYRFNLGTAKHRYPETTHWASGPPTHSEQVFADVWVGSDPDPVQPRILRPRGAR